MMVMGLLMQQTAMVNDPLVFSLDARLLDKNRRAISAESARLEPAYKALLKEADKALRSAPVSVIEKTNTPPSGDKHDYMSLAPYFWPDPSKPGGLPYIRKDGQTNPEVKDYKDKEYMPALCRDLETLSLAYYFSGDEKYAAHATTLLRTWFLDPGTRMNPNLNYAQAIKGVNNGRGAGMIDARHFIKLVDAIGLIGASKSWAATDQQGMKKWFADFLQWMQTSPVGQDEMDAPNNHGAWYDALRLSLALFIGDTGQAKKISLNAQERLDKQMDNDGRFPKELERTISLHYTVFAMDAFFTIAKMSESIGIDWWSYTSPSGKSLRKGFDSVKPYITREKEWDGKQIKPFEFDEGYNLLVKAEQHLDCKSCIDKMKKIAGENRDRLLINLLY